MLTNNLKKHVNFLTGMQPPRNYQNIQCSTDAIDTLDFESLGKVVTAMVEVLID
jgi:hypothetical protein